MFEEGIPFSEILGSQGKINSFVVGHCMWGISSFVIGLVAMLYMKHAKNSAVSFWIGLHFLLITIYCTLRVLSVWHAYYNLSIISVIFLGLVSTASMLLMVKIVMTIQHIETIKRLEEKIKHYESLKEENDAANTLV